MAKKKPPPKKSTKVAKAKSFRGRKGKYHEFLVTLKDLLDKNNKELALLLGKEPSNISEYLSGKKEVRKRMLQTGLVHLADWQITEDQVMLKIADRAKITTRPGIYFYYDSAGHCVYLGQTNNLRTEVNARLTTKYLRYSLRLDRTLKADKHAIKEVAQYVTTVIIESERVRHNMEALYLRTMINGTHNGKLGKYR